MSASPSGPPFPSPFSGDDTVPQAGSRQVRDLTVSRNPRSHVSGGAGRHHVSNPHSGLIRGLGYYKPTSGSVIACLDTDVFHQSLQEDPRILGAISIFIHPQAGSSSPVCLFCHQDPIPSGHREWPLVTSLVVQWLRIHNAGDLGSIPGRATKFPHASAQLLSEGYN